MIVHIRKFVIRFLGIAFILCGLCLLWYQLFRNTTSFNQRQWRPSSQTIEASISPTKPMVALTFDDGPHTPSTLRIVKALEQAHGKATFFVVGSRIEGREEALRAIDKSGSEIGNHTFHHVILKNLSEAEILQEITLADEAIEKVIGKKPTVVRLPGGIFPKHFTKPFARPIVLWSIDTMDWSHQNPQKTIHTVLNNVKDGDIILMHDLFLPTAEAAEYLIPALSQKGFQLVTVSELLKYRENISVKSIKSEKE